MRSSNLHMSCNNGDDSAPRRMGAWTLRWTHFKGQQRDMKNTSKYSNPSSEAFNATTQGNERKTQNTKGETHTRGTVDKRGRFRGLASRRRHPQLCPLFLSKHVDDRLIQAFHLMSTAQPQLTYRTPQPPRHSCHMCVAGLCRTKDDLQVQKKNGQRTPPRTCVSNKRTTYLDGTARELEAVHGPESSVCRLLVDVLDEAEALVPPCRSVVGHVHQLQRPEIGEDRPATKKGRFCCNMEDKEVTGQPVLLLSVILEGYSDNRHHKSGENRGRPVRGVTEIASVQGCFGRHEVSTA